MFWRGDDPSQGLGRQPFDRAELCNDELRPTVREVTVLSPPPAPNSSRCVVARAPWPRRKPFAPGNS